MYKALLHILIILPALTFGSIEDLEPKNVEIAELQDLFLEPLFVSLGSSCEVAHLLRECGVRKAAFPFDWILSWNGEKIIEVLEDNFLHFLNSDYLAPYEYSGALLHTYYHLEFLHEGIWRGNQYGPLLEKLKPKYQRRIDRFREINNFAGKVFFLRSACVYSTVQDPVRYFKNKENLEITEEYSLRLYATLKNMFPDLNFCLIIINIHNRGDIEIDKLSDNLIMIRANPMLDGTFRINVFKQFFTKLISNSCHFNITTDARL